MPVGGGVELPDRRRHEQLSEQARELLTLPGVRCPEEPLFVVEVIEEGGIDNLAAMIGEGNEPTSPIRGIGLAFHEAGSFETVQALGHAAGRELTDSYSVVGFIRLGGPLRRRTASTRYSPHVNR